MRLDVFRLLVRAGEDGLPAGEVARTLDVLPNTLSANLNILSGAGLIRARRKGRQQLYSAQFSRRCKAASTMPFQTGHIAVSVWLSSVAAGRSE
jgi:DNA-binding transcriptional ArsR family regulator